MNTLIFMIISCMIIVNANINSTLSSTYLRRNLSNNDNNNLCNCDKVVCGLCMTGCSPSTSNNCQTGRNWCYCNIIGTDCLEDKYAVCGLQPTYKPTSKPTPRPTSKPTHLPTRPTSSPTNEPTNSPTLSTLLPTNTHTITVSYVFIQVTSGEYLNLQEVQLFYNNIQVPLSALTATMSSTWYPASRCIDGLTAPPPETVFNGICQYECQTYLCHTLDGNGWLRITVSGYSVNKIVVWNRIHCCQGRINGANIVYSYDMAGNNVIYKSTFSYTSSLVYTFDFSGTTSQVSPNVLPTFQPSSNPTFQPTTNPTFQPSSSPIVPTEIPTSPPHKVKPKPKPKPKPKNRKYEWWQGTKRYVGYTYQTHSPTKPMKDD